MFIFVLCNDTYFFVIKSARNGRQSSSCGVEQKPNTWTKQRHFVTSLHNNDEDKNY